MTEREMLKEKEYKRLPNGYGAVPLEIQMEIPDQYYVVDMVFGKVNKYTGPDDNRQDFDDKFDTVFDISKGKEHIGIELLTPGIAIRIVGMNNAKHVDLIFLDNYHNKKNIYVDKSEFRQRGFNIDAPKSDKLGETMDPEISQFLYDFQLGQGQFSNQA